MSYKLTTVEDQILSIQGQLPGEVASILGKRDGPEQLIPILRAKFDPCPRNQETIWDLTAQAYSIQGRHYEALSIYEAMYEQMMEIQKLKALRVHKGTPLVRLSDEHRWLGNPVLSKRFLMLTVCEDAISLGGKIPAETSGSYFRMVWQSGVPAVQLKRYAENAWVLSLENAQWSAFPEWILQELDQQWMMEYPATGEAAFWIANRSYIQRLLQELGKGDGLALERLAHYLLSCVPGFRARMRTRSKSTDYDVICAPEGLMYDFRSELGRYILCECKDWNEPANFAAVSKFASVLRSAKCCAGIIFSKKGISGEGQTLDAEREVLKTFQSGNIAILVFSKSDLERIASGGNFFSMLRQKYEQLRLDLPKSAFRDEQ